MIVLSFADFSKNESFKRLFQVPEDYQSVKRFDPRSGPTERPILNCLQKLYSKTCVK